MTTTTTSTTSMGPPPPRDHTTTTAELEPELKTSVMDEPPELSSTTETAVKSLMGPPPPQPNKNPNSTPPETTTTSPSSSTGTEKENPNSKHSSVPYTIPEWSGPPCHKFYLEILKDGSIIDQFDVCEKGAYMFGRVDLCDFVLEHPTISRFHAVLQFKRNGEAYLYDLGSMHGTFINKSQVEKRVHVALHVGDVIRFGLSSRLYIFQGPPDLMPPEVDRKFLRDANIQQEMLDREASLKRARLAASLTDGVTWGMDEDAIEEAEDDDDEITWQTYKGQLTEKQEKTREKVIKRMEKIAHMKKEIEAIRAKDIAQGGLTQGQQTQIARNEQRITQIMEELENLEETLNDSIRESVGARAGRISHGKRKGTTEDDDEFLSDDDEFYDRTKKLSVQKAGENQSIETADTLLDKRDALMKEMQDKKELVLIERNKMSSETAVDTETGDALDAYMSGLSTQLVLDKTEQLEKELSSVQSELERIFFLLRIADPSGEAAKKRELKVQELQPDKAEVPATTTKNKLPAESKKSVPLGKPKDASVQKQKTIDSVTAITENIKDASVQKQKTIDSVTAITEPNKEPEADKIVIDAPDGKPAVYTAIKPQWLGAVDNRDVKEAPKQEVLSMDEADQFVGYKDRQKILGKVDSEIQSAAPGLIIRKRKGAEKHGASDNGTPEQSSSSAAELMAEDAVALLLKHKKGYHAEDEEGNYESQEVLGTKKSHKDNKKPKRVLGPEKPSFLNRDSDYEAWVPPEGQSGDGRTSLNDRYGY